MSLKLMGYKMNEAGQYLEPTVLNTKEEVSKFIIDNVEEHYELRVCDSDDMCVLHVINQTLIFPVPENGDKNNRWNRDLQKFVH